MHRFPIRQAIIRVAIAFLVLLLASLAMWSLSPDRTQGVSISALTGNSLQVVLIGPVFPVFMADYALGLLAALLFWTCVAAAILRSQHRKARRWSNYLLGEFVLMTLVWIPLVHILPASTN